MRRLFTIFLALLFFHIGSDATAQQSRFDEANELLQNGEFTRAIDAYQSIRDDGYESGALWLNMGISYTRLDSLGMAKYSFLKAADFPETTDRATNALEYVNEQFPRQSAVLPQLPWIRFLDFVDEALGNITLLVIALFFLYTGTLLLIGSWFRADFRRLLRYSSYIAFGAAFLFLLLVSIITYRAERYDEAVMVNREEPVYQQPAETSAIISTAYEGYTMQIDQKESEPETGWYYIRLENGMYGWVQSDVLRIIDNS